MCVSEVHDGVVVYDSNDMCLHLERHSPGTPALAPGVELEDLNERMIRLFRIQESYHKDMRTINVATFDNSAQCNEHAPHSLSAPHCWILLVAG